MNSNPSEFYPPRANWFSAIRVRSIRLGLVLRAIMRPINFGQVLGSGDTILALLLPGYSVRRLGLPRIGTVMMVSYFLCGFVFLICLGYSVANYSFGLMLSLHVTSILFLLRRLIPEWTVVARLAAAIFILVAVSALVYWPIRREIQKNVMPLRTHSQVIVVNTRASFEKLRRGNWIAYHVPERSGSFQNAQAHGTIILREGFSFGQILGLPGDILRFSETNFFVNDLSFAREARMPKNTEMVIPEKHWFIWPDLAMSFQSDTAAIMQVDGFLKNRALIAQSNFVGTPFASWFWRKQILP